MDDCPKTFQMPDGVWVFRPCKDWPKARKLREARAFFKGQSRPALPEPDPVQVAEARERAESRGWSWLVHGGIGMLRWWLGIGREKQEIAAARLEICKGCEFYGAGVKCGKCGCKFRAKVTDAKEVCPLGKW